MQMIVELLARRLDGKRGLITIRLPNDSLDALAADMREIAVAGRLEPFRHFHLKSLSKPVCVLRSAFTVIAMKPPHSVDGNEPPQKGRLRSADADPRRSCTERGASSSEERTGRPNFA
jgi:hypothetical protein